MAATPTERESGDAEAPDIADPARSRKAEVRRQRMMEKVTAQGSMTAQDLASEFRVSIMTVHRDLEELERRGVLRRFRGGVSAQPSVVFESNVAYRSAMMLADKRVIARHAAHLLEPGMSVILDDSTTVLQMVPYLARVTPIHVATNFLRAINELAKLPDVRTMALGGDYDPTHDAFAGVMCQQAIESIRVDAAFFSASAVSSGAVYHQEQRVIAYKRSMMAVATKRYLLVDHSKLGKVALNRLTDLSSFDLVIVDKAAPDEALRDLENARVKFEIAG